VISVWNANNGDFIQARERTKDVGGAYYSADGQWILTPEMTTGRALLVWNTTTLSFVTRFEYMSYPPNFAVSPFTNLVASFSFGKLRLWDLKTSKQLAELPLQFGDHDNTRWVFLSESRLVIASDRYDFYYLVNLETYGVNKISFNELSSIAGRNPRAWSITKEAKIQALGFEALPAIQAITSDGNTLILARGYPTPQIIGLMNPNPGFDKLRTTEKEFNYLTMKGDSIVTIEWDWNVKQGDLVISEIGSDYLSVRSKTEIHYETSDTIEQVALSPNGSLLAIGTSDGALYLWDVNSKTQITRFQAHNKFFYIFGQYGSFSKIVFSPDGISFATQGDDYSVKLWNTEDGKELTSIYDAEYGDIAFSPSGKYFAYIGANNSIHIKSLQENIPTTVLAGDDSVDYSYILSLQFSSDESMLISGGGYQTVQIWSVADKTLLAYLPQSGYGTLSPDGTLLYVFTNDGFISVWGHNTQSE
jgi:WD40 repeat protein